MSKVISFIGILLFAIPALSDFESQQVLDHCNQSILNSYPVVLYCTDEKNGIDICLFDQKGYFGNVYNVSVIDSQTYRLYASRGFRKENVRRDDKNKLVLKHRDAILHFWNVSKTELVFDRKSKKLSLKHREPASIFPLPGSGGSDGPENFNGTFDSCHEIR